MFLFNISCMAKCVSCLVSYFCQQCAAGTPIFHFQLSVGTDHKNQTFAGAIHLKTVISKTTRVNLGQGIVCQSVMPSAGQGITKWPLKLCFCVNGLNTLLKTKLVLMMNDHHLYDKWEKIYRTYGRLVLKQHSEE